MEVKRNRLPIYHSVDLEPYRGQERPRRHLRQLLCRDFGGPRSEDDVTYEYA